LEIGDENEKLAKSIRDTLKKRDLGNFSKTWRPNATALEEWTPHDFLRGMENALSAPEPDMQSRERASAGPRDLPHINWPNLVRKATKGTFPRATGKQSGGDQDKKDAILDELEHLVDVRRGELALELMTQRNMQVQSWQKELDRLELERKEERVKRAIEEKAANGEIAPHVATLTNEDSGSPKEKGNQDAASTDVVPPGRNETISSGGKEEDALEA
jgi:hypothetical protein